jgi:hypothetical protein
MAILAQLLFPPWTATAFTVTRRNELPDFRAILRGIPSDTTTRVDRDSLHWTLPFWPIWRPPLYEQHLWTPPALAAAMTGQKLTEVQMDSILSQADRGETLRVALMSTLRLPDVLRGPDTWSDSSLGHTYFIARDKSIAFRLDIPRLCVQLLAALAAGFGLSYIGQLVRGPTQQRSPAGL